MCDKRHLHRRVVERRLCITGCRSTQSDAYCRSVDGTLLPAVMDQILVDNRELFIHHVQSTLPLILIVLSRLDRGIGPIISDGDVALEKYIDSAKSKGVLRIVVTAPPRLSICVLLTDLFFFYIVVFSVFIARQHTDARN